MYFRSNRSSIQNWEQYYKRDRESGSPQQVQAAACETEPPSLPEANHLRCLIYPETEADHKGQAFDHN
jgi:hypothetical protein